MSGFDLQQRLHDLLAAGTGEVAGLARDDLEVLVLADHVGEALGTVDRRCGARRALELHDVDLLGGVLVLVEHPEAGLLALLDEVGAEERLVERRVLAVDGTVGEHHGDAGRLGLVEHRVPAGLDDGREGDVVDALLDVGADRLDLVLLLLLRVGELELDARLVEGGLDVLGVGGAPARLRADLREPDDEFFDGHGALGCGVTATAVARASGECEQHGSGRGESDEFLHQREPPCSWMPAEGDVLRSWCAGRSVRSAAIWMLALTCERSQVADRNWMHRHGHWRAVAVARAM